MDRPVQSWTLAEIAKAVGGSVEGPEDFIVSRPVPAGSNDPSGITYAESEKYLRLVENSSVGAVLLSESFKADRPCVRVASPRAAFAMILAMARRPLPLELGVHPTAVVHPTACIDPSASIGAYVVIEQFAEVGPEARIHPFCYIGENCSVGAGSTLCPHVVLVQDVTIGQNSLLHPGCVLGADGFGFVHSGTKQFKIPQVGSVRIGSDVEIGANSCVDRATCSETVLKDDVKLDNLVQVGHNVEIGEHSVLAALIGLGGSVSLGKNVSIGGMVVVKDHITVGDGVSIAGRSGVMRDLSEPGEYFGLPAMPVRDAMRILALEKRLPELFERLKVLEAEVERLEPK